MKAERDPGLPLDQEHALKLTAAQLTSALRDNQAGASDRYRGKTLEVAGQVESVEKDWGGDGAWVNIELRGAEPTGAPAGRARTHGKRALAQPLEEVDADREDVTCRLVARDTARAQRLARGDQVVVVGRADLGLGAKLEGCVLK